MDENKVTRIYVKEKMLVVGKTHDGITRSRESAVNLN